MPGALVKRLDSTPATCAPWMRDKSVRHAGITREGNTVVIRFRDAAAALRADRRLILDSTTDLRSSSATMPPTTSNWSPR